MGFVKKTIADDILGIDDSGGIGGTVKKVARGVVNGVEVFADDFLGIDDSGGIIGTAKDIGSNFEDMVRETIDEVDKAVQNPYVRLAVRFIPGYGQVAGSVLDAYAKVDSGEELSAGDIANLATSFAAQDVSKWNLDPDTAKAIKTGVKIAEGGDPLDVLVSAYGPDIVEQMGLENSVRETIVDKFGEETYAAVRDNLDYGRAGYEILVEGADPVETILKYADDDTLNDFGREALVANLGEDVYEAVRDNLDVVRAGTDYLQGKDVSTIVADRFGEDIATALTDQEDVGLRAAALGTIRTGAMLDQGVPEYLAFAEGAETFNEYGGTEAVGDYLASVDTSGFGDYFEGIDLQPYIAGFSGDTSFLTPEQREQARLIAREVKTFTTAASRGAAEFEDVLRSTLPEGVELASVTGGDMNAYQQEVLRNLEGYDFSQLMPEGGYQATGGEGQYIATGSMGQYGKARSLFGAGEEAIDKEMAQMSEMAQLPEMAKLPEMISEEEEDSVVGGNLSFQLGDVQTAREGGRIKKQQGGMAQARRGIALPGEKFLKDNLDLVKRMPDAYYVDPGIAETADELDRIYMYNEMVTSLAGNVTRMQDGGVAGAVQPTQAVVSQPAGFVEQAPERVPDGQTVADDVPMDVEDGTFVLNAAAVEIAGSQDIKTMILDAIDEAKSQGIDIQFDDDKIADEEAVSLLVSRGEVIVPPVLAKIIGYDRLEKINNRGKKEVQKRVAKSEEQTEQQPVAAKSGGFISKPK